MRPPPRERLRVRRISVPLFLTTSALVGLLWWLDWRDWRAQSEARVERAAEEAAMRLNDYVEARLLVVDGFARLSAQRPLGEDEQRARTEVAQELYGGFQGINWLDDAGVIRFVAPLEPNRGALGRSVLDHPVAHTAFERARADGSPHMTEGIELFQGGRGFATYYPFEYAGERRYVNGVFRIRPLVETALRGGFLDEYGVALRDDRGGALLELDEELARADRLAGDAELTLLDRTWRLQARPRDGLWASMQSSRPGGVYLFVLVLLAIVATYTHLTLRARLERLQAQRRQAELERRLERTSKMESLGRLAGGVAHDFNNVLTAILQAVGLLERQLEGQPAPLRCVNIIVDASDRAVVLTRQLLEFARPDDESPRVPMALDVNGELDTMRSMLECLVPSTAELELDFGEGVGPIRIAPSQLGRIVVNLVVNAADALPERSGHIRVRTWRSADEVVLEVADDGSGMDAATRERIFEPFFTTKGRDEGTGLGLATVRELVGAAGGSITVESAPGEGTRFELRFPVLVVD